MITDTSKLPAYELLARALRAGRPGADIVEMEAEGQRELVNADALPRIVKGDGSFAVLEQFGVRILGPMDALFNHVALPRGWSKRATDHAMWTDLLDDKGRKRAAIFYKAAHYDRRAHLLLLTRYSVNLYMQPGSEDMYVTFVTDGGAPLLEIASRPRDDHAATDEHEKWARDWLAEHKPDWRNPAAYWE